jgi:hypothetical protein
MMRRLTEKEMKRVEGGQYGLFGLSAAFAAPFLFAQLALALSLRIFLGLWF